MVDVDPSPVGQRSWPFHNRGYACPKCGSWRVVPAVAGGTRRRFCVACAACWEVHGDLAVSIDPLRCPGCGREDQCYGRLRDAFPTFVYAGVE